MSRYDHTKLRRVTLTDEQRLAVIRIGEGVQGYADKIGFHCYWNANDRLRYPRGYIAHLACAMLLKVPFLPVVGPEGDWARGDLVLRADTPEEHKVDVKGIHYREARPPYLPWEYIYCQKPDPDKFYLFALAGGQKDLNCNVVTVLGWYDGRLIPETFQWTEVTPWGTRLPYPGYEIPLWKLWDEVDLMPGGRYGEVETLF